MAFEKKKNIEFWICISNLNIEDKIFLLEFLNLNLIRTAEKDFLPNEDMKVDLEKNSHYL